MEWYEMGLALFAVLLLLLALGVPVAFSLGIAGMVGVYFFLSPAMLMQIARISFEVGSTHLFIVAPLFVLMAGLVSQSDVAERSFDAAKKWLNWLPGSLGVATVASATLFASISGSSPATAAAIGYTAVPEMLRNGYDKRLAVGIVAAGGTLGILIPPSVVMIIYGIITETSIGALFTAGIVPGLLFSALLSGYVIWKSRDDHAGQRLKVSWGERFGALSGIWPIMVLFAVVMGSIYSGIATPTEAAGIGAGAALLLTFGRKGMGFAGLDNVLIRTAQTTAMILLLIVCGSFFGFVVAAVGVAHGLVEALTEAEIQPIWVLVGYLVVLLILGCLMDPASMLVITLPIAFPVLKDLGFDAVWLGILVTVAVEIGMITPPVGLNLFVLKGVVPKEISTGDIAAGAVPFVFVLLLGMLIVLAVPEIATWLPRAVGY